MFLYSFMVYSDCDDGGDGGIGMSMTTILGLRLMLSLLLSGMGVTRSDLVN